jgi:cold shock CspA family protein/tetratricopeptide (TPR) repeat protein
MTSPQRQRLFGLFDALESDLTESIRFHLLRDLDEAQLLTGPEVDQAEVRRDDHGDEDLIVFLDLPVKVDVLLRWKSKVSAPERAGLPTLASEGPRIYPIRNRVMHGRPLRPGDAEACFAFASTLASSTLDLPRFKATFEHLKADTSWLPPGTLQRPPSLVVHNVPDADYDDTGLVGRHKEREKLRQKLLANRWPVNSVIAPGGFGKTALVIDVLHSLVDDPDCPFEMIAWVSLKTERLTFSGIQEVDDSVRSLSDALPHIGSLLDSDSKSTVELADLLDGIPTLLVLDNLETATSDEVMAFVEEMPENVRFLFTSRVGIGQVEVRFDLEALTQGAATDLLRKLGSARGIYLAAERQEQLSKLASDVGLEPLALRWFAEGVAAGLEPKAVLEQKADLVAFCVGNVFESLPEDAQKVAWLLRGMGRSTPVPDIHAALPDWTIDRGRKAIQQLTLRMFVTRAAIGGTQSEELDLTGTLRTYLRGVQPDPQLIQEIDRAVKDNERERERLHQDRERGGLRPNVVLGGAEHAAAQMELRRALSSSRGGKISKALDHVARARELDPEFFEVFRVRAFILQQEQPSEATAAYEQSLALAANESEEDRATVQYYFAGHLLRGGSDEMRGLALAREAHATLARPKTAFAVADALRRQGDYVAALTLLDFAISETDDEAFKTVATTLAMNLRKRLAEGSAYDDEVQPSSAELLLKAIDQARPVFLHGVRDEKLVREVIRCGSDLLSVIAANRDLLRGLAGVPEALELVRDVMAWAPPGRDVDWLRRNAVRAQDALLAIGIPVPDDLLAAPETTDVYVGLVDWYDAGKGYGFIESPSLGRSLFVHANDLVESSDLVFLVKGAEFEFSLGVDGTGRERATLLRLYDAHRLGDSLLDRVCHIFLRRDGFSLARDQLTGATVFVGKHQIREPEDWERVVSEVEVQLDIEVVPDGKFRAVDRSVRVV